MSDKPTEYGPVRYSYSRSEELGENIKRLQQLFESCHESDPKVAFGACIEINRLTGLDEPTPDTEKSTGPEKPHPMLCVRHGGSKPRAGTCPLCLLEKMNLDPASAPYRVCSVTSEELYGVPHRAASDPEPCRPSDWKVLNKRIDDLEKRLGRQPAHTQARLVALEDSANRNAKDGLRLKDRIDADWGELVQSISGLGDRVIDLERINSALRGRMTALEVRGVKLARQLRGKLSALEPGEEQGVPPVAYRESASGPVVSGAASGFTGEPSPPPPPPPKPSKGFTEG